jgi:hypothetical protein
MLEMQDNNFTVALINTTSLYGAYECVIGLLSRKNIRLQAYHFTL